MKRRVVVTGIGAVNPLGIGVQAMWSGLTEGRSGVGTITRFDASRFTTKIAAEVKHVDSILSAADAGECENFGLHSVFAIGAARQAVKSSGIFDSQIDPARFGVYLGSGEGNQSFSAFTEMMTAALSGGEFDLSRFVTAGFTALDPRLDSEQEPIMPVAHLARIFQALGPNSNCLTACAASNQAIGEASEMIRRGDADVMLAGGTHSMIHPLGVTGFCLLTALSTRNDEPTKASRPFDRLRDGFVMGEGAAMVVLEDAERARQRGAAIHGEILGYGATADGYRITDIPPDGRGAVRCMRHALREARLSPNDIDYVNAHGTATTINDRIETRACKEVFGSHAPKVPISSTKSMMGHLICAAGASEVIACLLAIRDNVVPPTINLENPDPDCDLDYVPNQAREVECNVAMNNSFAFGGQNVTVIVGRYRG